jgi:2-methylaconitate cis-trans-isomerase PrpF
MAVVAPASDNVRIEHPTGTFDARVKMDLDPEPRIISAGIVRTARKLMDVMVFPRSY